MEETLYKTLGELRVRSSCNIKDSGTVTAIKHDAAKQIDRMRGVWSDTIAEADDMDPQSFKASYGEQERLIELAQKAYEEAAMWAEKAVTFEPYY